MADKVNKICCVIPSLILGGMERVMSELVNNFAERENVEVHLILYGRIREVKYILNSKVIIHRPNFEFDNDRRAYYTFKSMVWLRQEVKSLSPNSILSFGEYWNNLVLISLLGLHFPLYLSDRSTPDKNLGAIHNFLQKHLYKYASGIICQTSKAKDITLKRGRYRNVTVIGNPIRAIENQSTNREDVVISVGRLITTKHFDRLIRIFASIDTHWKLKIVGGDAQKQSNFTKLQQLIAELKAEGKIELLGYRTDVDELLCNSKIFAFTSSSEGFPNVVGEAMSAGLPTIAYDCMAGPSDMIEDGANGYIIPLFDDTMFAQKLKFLIDHSSERETLAIHAKQSIGQFDAGYISQKYFEFITE